MTSTHKTLSGDASTDPQRSPRGRSRASSFRLVTLLLVGFLLVGAAWWLRSSPWLHDSFLRNKSLPELEALVRQQPEDALAQYYLAKGYYLNRRFSEARAAYEEAVRLDRNSARAHLGLGLALCELGE